MDQDFFEKSIEKFHPYDKDFMKILKTNYKFQKSGEHYENCLYILRLTLENLRKNLPLYYDVIGLTEISTSEICIKLNLLEEAEMHINKAEEIFRVTHGINHSLITRGCSKIRQDINVKNQVQAKHNLK